MPDPKLPGEVEEQRRKLDETPTPGTDPLT
jgi:hypothetical protein